MSVFLECLCSLCFDSVCVWVGGSGCVCVCVCVCVVLLDCYQDYSNGARCVGIYTCGGTHWLSYGSHLYRQVNQRTCECGGGGWSTIVIFLEAFTAYKL